MADLESTPHTPVKGGYESWYPFPMGGGGSGGPPAPVLSGGRGGLDPLRIGSDPGLFGGGGTGEPLTLPTDPPRGGRGGRGPGNAGDGQHVDTDLAGKLHAGA